MLQITYKTRTQRFLDDFEAAGLRELLNAIEARLSALEAQSSPTPADTSPSELAVLHSSVASGLIRRSGLLTRRLDALESQQTSAAVASTDKAVALSPALKRKRGRKPGFKQPWSEARHEAYRLKKERRALEIANNPRAQALMSALSSMTGKPTQMPNGAPTLAPDASQASS